MSSNGKESTGPVKMNFKQGSFNNTQKFTNHQLIEQQYQKAINLQQSDLIQLRDNYEFLNPVIQCFSDRVDTWVDIISSADGNTEMSDLLKDIIQNWITPHQLDTGKFLNLVYLFEVAYQVGNSQSIKSDSTANTWQNWWNRYGIIKENGQTKQLVLNESSPEDISTLYWLAGLQNQLAQKIMNNSCRANLRDMKQSPQTTDLTPILATDIDSTYGVAPVCPHLSPASFVRQSPADFKAGLKYLLLFWRKCLANLGERGTDNKTIHFVNLPVSEGIIKTDTFYVALDCEYVSHNLKDSARNSKVRDTDDVLSFQLYAINAKGTKRNGIVVHNTTKQHFVQSELVSAIQQVIEPLRFANVKDSSSRRAIVHLVGYYSGVDISCFNGWERFWNNTNTIVLKKNAPFTRGYVNKKLSDGSSISIDLIDLMNDAPVGGLKVVGDMVGIQKIDTEKFDKADGLPIGYYKSHMDIFRDKRPNDFNKYAMNDSIITLEYALFLKKTLGRIPKTLGSYAAAEVSKQRQDYPSQFLADPAYPLREYVESKGSERVRPGQADLYDEACKAMFGGHNVAYVSGYGYGRILDFDLASAYNIGGHLLPVIDYSDDDYSVIEPPELPKFMKRGSFNCEVSNSFRLKDCDFELIGKQMEKTSVFLVGIGLFKIDYPDDIQMVVTPSHSTTGAPIYVKHYSDWCTLLDAYTAWKHGATVHVIRLRVPKQNQNSLNVFGDFQNKEIKLRNAAKEKMKHSKQESLQYAQANGEQLLHKLAANTTFGKTLQGTGNHRSRDFDTYLMSQTPKSPITDPLIGDNYTSFTRYLVCVQCDGQGGRLHVHLLINAVKENGKTIPTNRFSVFKMRRDFNDYLQDNFEHVTSRTWSNPFSNHLVRKDLSDLPTRSKWEEQLKSIINTVKQEVTNAKTFLSKLSEFGITVSERKQGKSWTYHQTLTTKNGDTKEMKARDFYQRKDKKTGEILTTRGLGSSYTKQSLEVFWQKQLLKQEEFESQSPLTSHKQSKKEVNKDDSTDVQSEQLEKFKSLARDVQARANQQQVRRQLNLQHLCAETKEYKQRVKRQNRQAISRRSDQKRFSNISKQRRANEVATRKLKELQRRKSNNHVKNEGPDL